MNAARSTALLALAALLACSDSEPGTVEVPLPGTATLRGRVALLGADDAAGAVVSLGSGGRSVTVGADGSFELAGIADGFHSLQVRRGAWEETLPAVLVTTGRDALVLDDGLQPLPLVEVPRAHRLATGAVPTFYASPATGAALFVAAADADAVEGTLLVARAQDAVPTAVAYGTTTAGTVARFSPDGTRFLFVSEAATYDLGGALVQGAPLWIAPTAGGATTLLAEETHFSTAFTPDGAHVVYADRDGWKSVPSGGGAPTDLGAYEPASLSSSRALVLRPGGAGLARDLWSVSLADGSEVLLSEDACQPELSPDGAYVVFRSGCAAGTPTLQLASAAGGSPRALGGDGFARFTSDGAKLLYLDAASDPHVLKVVEVAGGDPVPLAESDGSYFTLSPDETVVVFNGAALDAFGNFTTLEAIPVAGGEQVTIAPRARTFGWQLPGEQQARLVAFTSDGAHVLFYGVDEDLSGPHGLYTVPATGGVPARLGPMESFALTPDGARVLFFSETDPYDGRLGTLASAPASGGSASKIASRVQLHTLLLSPDGAHVALVVDDGPDDPTGCGTLHLAPASGGPSEPYLRNVREASWAGNGALYAVSCGNAAPFRWRDGVYRLTVE